MTAHVGFTCSNLAAANLRTETHSLFPSLGAGKAEENVCVYLFLFLTNAIFVVSYVYEVLQVP